METAIVSGRGAARWRRGHPWIYESDVVRRPEAPAGAVRVEESGGRMVGTALWSPGSTISLRMLSSEEVRPDAEFFARRIGAAADYRESLAPDATAYRIVHAEADGLPSLVVDRYGDQLVVQLLSAGLESYRGEIVDGLVNRFRPAGILARNDASVRRRENLPREVTVLHGEVPEELEVREGGIRYLAELRSGQKTGAFLDQRENRLRAGSLARHRALDCFSYHGSFALHLAAAADEVVAVDSSSDALARGRRNAEINGLRTIRTVEANVFDFLRAEEQAGSRYDVIVLDPPAFAKSRRAVQGALRGYKEINLRAMRILSPGGHLLTFSCSYHVGESLFRQVLEDSAADAGLPLRWIEARGQSLDHPVLLQVPESAYLKGAVLQRKAGD